MPFKSVHLECTRGPHLPFPVSLNVPRLLFQLVWRGPCYCSPQGRYLLHLGSWLDHHLHGTAVRAFSPSHTAPRGPLPPPPSLSVSTQVLQQKLCCINPCPGLFTALAMSAQRLSWVLFKRLSATSDARSRTSQRRLPRNQTAIRRIFDREHQQGPVERLSLDAVERCRMERTLIDPQR